MTEFYRAAVEIQRLGEQQGWSFCFIGGSAVQRILARQKGQLDFDLIRRELRPLLKLQEQPEKLERLEQKIREHARPFTTLPPPGRKS